MPIAVSTKRATACYTKGLLGLNNVEPASAKSRISVSAFLCAKRCGVRTTTRLAKHVAHVLSVWLLEAGAEGRS
jgi:hypothetical protein